MNLAWNSRHVIRTQPVGCDRILNGRRVSVAEIGVVGVVARLPLGGGRQIGLAVVPGVVVRKAFEGAP